ncbi:MAG: HesA/MoeB/ThiF family protein [Bacteroidia bacterium]|nr:HesA/MoeB/ThiF family protein [Bacteroidia bacterium]MDW8089503.1 HesA/MoeB/ThiF family protein [Bacteroidia bacterium]
MATNLRYEPQQHLPGWSQEKLGASTALVVGVGGLGQPAALYLAAMGIGKLILVDPDTVAEVNLHRQPLYTEADLGKPKVEVLAAHLRRLRADLEIETHAVWADRVFLETYGKAASVWIDGTDNLASRLALDEAAAVCQKPWVYGAVYQGEGQAALLVGVQYREFFGAEEGGPSCSVGGVLGALPGAVGALQAALAAQYLAQPALAPVNILFRLDLLRGLMQSFALEAAEPVAPLELSWEATQAFPTAQWIDLRENPLSPLPIPAQRLPWYSWAQWKLPSQPVIIVCEQGERSRQIAYALRRQTGRTDIFSLRGGVQQISLKLGQNP